MTATDKARQALADLEPYQHEQHALTVHIVALLVEQNEHLAELVKQGQRDSTTATAGTPITGAGRSAAGTPPAAADQDKEADVRLTEPAVPAPDPDPAPTVPAAAKKDDANPAPAKKATARPRAR